MLHMFSRALHAVGRFFTWLVCDPCHLRCCEHPARLGALIERVYGDEAYADLHIVVARMARPFWRASYRLAVYANRREARSWGGNDWAWALAEIRRMQRMYVPDRFGLRLADFGALFAETEDIPF